MPQEPPGTGSPVPPSPPGSGRSGAGRATDPDAAEAARPRFAPGAERADEGRPRAVAAGTAPDAQAARRQASSAAPGGDPNGRDRGRPDGGRATGRAGRRARKVRRVVRHVDPWSVLKVSVLFYLVLFLIISVAASVLWGVGRQTGAIENVESFITDYAALGDCVPIEEAPEGTEPPATVPTTLPAEELDQIEPGGDVGDTDAPLPDQLRDDDGCLVGEEVFVGTFQFEGDQLFQAFIVGGLILVLAGAAGNVVLAVLFNLISDLTGGVRVTVLEELPAAPASRAQETGSPPPRDGG